MKYQEKMAQLAGWAKTKIEAQGKSPLFEVRVDDRDPDYLCVRLFLRDTEGHWEQSSALVTVSCRPGTSGVRLVVNISCTFCHEYGDAAPLLWGFSDLRGIATGLHSRTKDQEFEV